MTWLASCSNISLTTDECGSRFLPTLRLIPIYSSYPPRPNPGYQFFASGRALLLQDGFVDPLLEVGKSAHVLHPTSIKLERHSEGLTAKDFMKSIMSLSI